MQPIHSSNHGLPPPQAGADPFRLIEELAIELATRAGETLFTFFRQPLAVEFKDKERADPVTAADHAVEALVTEAVRARFPDHAVLGEEGGPQDVQADFIWAVDPLDGTKNFTCGVPLFATSIGVLFRGAPVVAAIFVPGPSSMGGGVFHARLGGGAYRDGVPLSATTVARPVAARLTALPSRAGRQFRFDDELAKQPGEIRGFGSIVYELALIADGGLQFALFRGPKIWDVAAGILLVREAGGEVYEWRRGGLQEGFRHHWRPFRRFEAAPVRKTPEGKPTGGLRGWQQPLLVGGGAVASYVREHVRPREEPWLRRLLRRALRVLRAKRSSPRSA